MTLHSTHPTRRSRPKPPGVPDLAQPHDALFRWTFSQHRHAVGLLKAALPAKLAAATAWSTLRLESGSHVDQALRGRHSDLVFSAEMLGKPVFFYALIEHQRHVAPLMIFRMGLYMMRRWEQVVRDHPDTKELPPIFPLLIHHSDTGWTAATAFQDIVATGPDVRSELLPYTPRFEMRLIDLSEGQADDLVQGALTALVQVVFWCLSVAGDDTRMEREIERIGSAVNEMLRAPDGHAALEVLLRYLLATHEHFDVKKIANLLEKAAGPKAREAIVTELDEIERRGELRGERTGERRGERTGQARMLLKQLTIRFGPVPAEVSAQVMAADQATLSRWAARVLTAPTLETVLAKARASASKARASASPARRSSAGASASKRAR